MKMKQMVLFHQKRNKWSSNWCERNLKFLAFTRYPPPHAHVNVILSFFLPSFFFFSYKKYFLFYYSFYQRTIIFLSRVRHSHKKKRQWKTIITRFCTEYHCLESCGFSIKVIQDTVNYCILLMGTLNHK